MFLHKDFFVSMAGPPAKKPNSLNKSVLLTDLYIILEALMNDPATREAQRAATLNFYADDAKAAATLDVFAANRNVNSDDSLSVSSLGSIESDNSNFSLQSSQSFEKHNSLSRSSQSRKPLDTPEGGVIVDDEFLGEDEDPEVAILIPLPASLILIPDMIPFVEQLIHIRAEVMLKNRLLLLQVDDEVLEEGTVFGPPFE
jgi:hypothetical protein